MMMVVCRYYAKRCHNPRRETNGYAPSSVKRKGAISARAGTAGNVERKEVRTHQGVASYSQGVGPHVFAWLNILIRVHV